MRELGCGLLLVASLALGCGKLGPPLRNLPPEPAEATPGAEPAAGPGVPAEATPGSEPEPEMPAEAPAPTEAPEEPPAP